MKTIKREGSLKKVMFKGKMKRREFFTATALNERFYGYLLNDIPEDLFPLEQQRGYFNCKGVTYISPAELDFKYLGNSNTTIVTESDFDYLKNPNQKDFKYAASPEEDLLRILK